jgi:hypothetical protein
VLRFYCDLNVECEDSPPLHRFGIRNPKLHQGHGVAPGTGGGPFRIFCALRLYARHRGCVRAAGRAPISG